MTKDEVINLLLIILTVNSVGVVFAFLVIGQLINAL